ELVLRGVTNETSGVVHLVHDFVTGINAQGTANAFVLQAIPDVDAGGAHLNALFAVNAIAQAQLGRLHSLLAVAPGLTPVRIVRHHSGIGIEHDRLETGIWAHIQAYLLTHPAGV